MPVLHVVKCTLLLYILCVSQKACQWLTVHWIHLDLQHPAGFYVYVGGEQKEQYSWLMTFQARKKQKNPTCLVDTLHYRLLRLLLMEKLEHYLFFLFNTESVKNAPNFLIHTGPTQNMIISFVYNLKHSFFISLWDLNVGTYKRIFMKQHTGPRDVWYITKKAAFSLAFSFPKVFF